MLGILGVHMPLLYGEGRNAFHRLLTEVIKISADETLFAHSGLNILADGPENYSKTINLAPLSGFLDLHSYHITNIGIRIHMKIFNDASNRCFGILNCHISQDLDNYIAIPLKRQPNAAVFTRANGEHRVVPENLVNQIVASEILILLKVPRISEVTCLLQHKKDASWNYTISARCSSHISWLGEYDRVNMVLDPRKDVKYEILEYRLDSNGFGQSFAVQAIFNLEENKAGVLIRSSFSDSLIDDQDVYRRWNYLGKPSDAKVDFTGTQPDLGKSVTQRVMASMRSELRLQQPVWVLTLEVQSIVPNAP
jgi:hypothetical protein